jgi:hypothetical protein
VRGLRGWRVPGPGMPEVLGPTSLPQGVDIRSLRDRAVRDVRPDPWEPPKLTGVTRVRRELYGLDDAIRADYESGMGCTLLARKYCVAENTMLAWLKSHGVELRPPGKLTPEDVVQIPVSAKMARPTTPFGRSSGSPSWR